MIIKCKKCFNEWNYGGKSLWEATCPTCRLRLPVPITKEILLGRIDILMGELEKLENEGSNIHKG